MRDLAATVALNEAAARREGAGPVRITIVACSRCGNDLRIGAEPYYRAGDPIGYFHAYPCKERTV